MNIKKTAICMLLATGFLFSQSGVSLAETKINRIERMKEVYSVMPLWVNAHVVSPSISASGRNISLSLLISPKDKALESSGTLYLERYSGGRWIGVDSWSFSQTGTVSMRQSYRGDNNSRYRSKVVVSVGTEKISEKSAEVVAN